MSCEFYLKISSVERDVPVIYHSLWLVYSMFTCCLVYPGYGHITPQTQSGRIFLIIFALIGIPLNILALASVGEHITVAIFNFLRYISQHCCCQKKNNRIKHINIKVMMVSVFLMVCMLFIGGLLYCSTEEWSYVDSIYYCFVAMATIGFGDLVPNKGRAPDSEGEKAIWFLRALYLSVGLSLVSTVFTALKTVDTKLFSPLCPTPWKKSISCSVDIKMVRYVFSNLHVS